LPNAFRAAILAAKLLKGSAQFLTGRSHAIAVRAPRWASAGRSVKGPLPGRGPTSETRRFQSFAAP